MIVHEFSVKVSAYVIEDRFNSSLILTLPENGSYLFYEFHTFLWGKIIL